MTTGITSILKNILKFITFIGAVVAAVCDRTVCRADGIDGIDD